jgi:hypothetical protein
VTGVKILALHGDMLVSPYTRTPWRTARLERSHDYHGIYAFAAMADALREREARLVAADVEADGEVRVHDSGWHADAATITRIFLPMRHWRMRPALLARYGVPIEPLSRITMSRVAARRLRLWMAMHYADDMMPVTHLPDDDDDPALVASIRHAQWRHDRAGESLRLPAMYDPLQARIAAARAAAKKASWEAEEARR